LLITVALLFFSACDVTKPLKKNEYLLTHNRFKISTPKISSDDLNGYLQQKPNSKLFGLFRANIAFYNMGNKGKDSKFKKWLRTKVGSAPELLDTTLIPIAVKQMGLYLNNKGYFGSVIYDSIALKNKKAKVYYIIKASRPYTIRNISYSIADTQVASFMMKDTSKCVIKRGRNYDAYELESERSRIAAYLLNQGYYRFSTTYVIFHIDSTTGNRQMDVNIEITNPVVPSLDNLGSFIQATHNRYFINRIFIDPDFSLLGSDTIRYDTVPKNYRVRRADTLGTTYYFLTHGKFRVKPRTIAQSVLLYSGEYYNTTVVKQSYSQISALGVYKFVNIHFEEPQVMHEPHKNPLDCKIQLARAPVQSFSISTDGTNSGGALGVQAALVYQNRNIFRGAQLLRLSLSAAAQMQGSIGTTGSNLFNTIEFGINGSLTFPQFFFPLKPERLPKSLRPKTVVSIGYNFQKRTDYVRYISNVAFGYTWVQNDQIRHMLDPIEILLVKVFPDSSFSAELNSLTDKRLKNQYTDHIIAGLKYTFTFNNQNVHKAKDFFYIRSNFETGGNLIYCANELFNSRKTSGDYYTLFGIQYAQFVRPDFDLRFYEPFSNKTSMVYRFYGGIGIAYGNSLSLPFEKAFFAGGANDLRGWKMGALGPGTYHNDTLSNSFDQTGDMQLQINLEYRFPVYKMIKSAVFVDMGNVWILRDSPDLPGGTFHIYNFLDQVAIDVGFGIRADFDFFIFRLDPAVPIRVPYYPNNDHWYFSKIQLKDIIWNFGIGYPF
jgi:outer membrane protein assembly factor BamA